MKQYRAVYTVPDIRIQWRKLCFFIALKEHTHAGKAADYAAAVLFQGRAK